MAKEKAVLVTGAGGYLGSFVIKKLKQKKIPFVAFFKKRRNLSESSRYPQRFYGNLNDPLSLENAMGKAQDVIHLASTLSSNLNTVVGYDLKGMQTLVSFWNKGDFIFTSSMDVYPEVENMSLIEESALHPSNFYGLGKLACEKILLMDYEAHIARGTCPTYKILRLPFILGKHERFPGSHFGKIIQKALRGEDFILRESHSGTSWIDATELTDFMIKIIRNPISGIYNIANGWIYWEEAIEAIIRSAKSKSRIVRKGDGERFPGIKGKFLDFRKAQRDFGFQPQKTFNEAIEEILDLELYRRWMS
jgi:nucleoside-diphosphate-sugar epimerase